jgi:hypothetical protein
MGNNIQTFNHCAFCNIQTSICEYYFKYKKNICSNCINYIQSCCHCAQWYSKGLIRYNEKLFCIPCLNDLTTITTKCNLCEKMNTNTIIHKDKIYCMTCISKLSMLKKTK